MDTLVAVRRLVQQTETFVKWHTGLRDLRARMAIARRIERAAAGNLGDTKSVGDGVSELRIDVGPGYRVYFALRAGALVILLCGGAKTTQASDIRRARKLVKEIEP